MRGSLSHSGKYILKQSYICTRGLLSRVNSRSIYVYIHVHGFCDAGTRLLFKLRSGTHGLNEVLGRPRGREGKVQCSIRGAEYESEVDRSHVVGVSSL